MGRGTQMSLLGIEEMDGSLGGAVLLQDGYGK
jgi:hypothetical protein